MLDDGGTSDDQNVRRRVFGGRASRLEVYLIAALLFVVAAGGISGAVVVASSEGGSSADLSVTTPQSELEGNPSSAPSVSAPVTSSSVTAPSVALAPSPPRGVPEASSRLSDAELAYLQSQAQKALEEQAKRDATLRGFQIDGCGLPPYPEYTANWNGGSWEERYTYSFSGSSVNLSALGYELSRVARIGCYFVGLGSSNSGSDWTINWNNTDITAAQVQTAVRNLGYVN